MVTKEESKVAFNSLSSLQMARMGQEKDTLFLHSVDLGHKVHFTTLVYQGDKFIPLAVREAASSPLEEPQKTIHPWLSLDEMRYQIFLHYIKEFSTMNVDDLHETVSQFEDTAIKWREVFEERDRQDLVHIPVHSR